MSFNRLNFDKCQYKQTLFESIGPGNYSLGTPPIACNYCYPTNPTTRLQKAGNSIDRRPLVDTHSDLLNITRKASKCCQNSWKKDPSHCNWLSKTKFEKCHSSHQTVENFQQEGELTKRHFEDCFLPTEHARLVDPACNLRGTGWNRFEYLCFSPQANCLAPFDHGIASRIVTKDCHRPCLPKPIDQRLPLPKDNGPLPCEKTKSTCANFTSDGIQWRNSKNY
ncbi:MAG: hypothetical protein ABF272_08020 [Flavobacteriales bacterium]